MVSQNRHCENKLLRGSKYFYMTEGYRMCWHLSVDPLCDQELLITLNFPFVRPTSSLDKVDNIFVKSLLAFNFIDLISRLNVSILMYSLFINQTLYF